MEPRGYVIELLLQSSSVTGTSAGCKQVLRKGRTSIPSKTICVEVSAGCVARFTLKPAIRFHIARLSGISNFSNSSNVFSRLGTSRYLRVAVALQESRASKKVRSSPPHSHNPEHTTGLQLQLSTPSSHWNRQFGARSEIGERLQVSTAWKERLFGCTIYLPS